MSPCSSELAVLAELADVRAALEAARGPSLLRVKSFGDEIELGWLALPAGTHPLDELVGRAVPDDWEALGVVAPGRAHRLDGPSDAPPLVVRSTHLVGRDGSWASRCQPDGGAPLVADGGPDDADRVVGRIDDACRLALGLPTAAPCEGTGALWAVQWLDAVVATVGRHPARRGLGWPAVARLHPAVAALLPGAAGGEAPPAPAELGAAAAQLAVWRDWTVLRRSCAAGTTSVPEIDPDLAAWLDDGAFSRWALGAYPDLDGLLSAASDLLPRPVAAAVRETLAATGVAP